MWLRIKREIPYLELFVFLLLQQFGVEWDGVGLPVFSPGALLVQHSIVLHLHGPENVLRTFQVLFLGLVLRYFGEIDGGRHPLDGAVVEPPVEGQLRQQLQIEVLQLVVPD